MITKYNQHIRITFEYQQKETHLNKRHFSRVLVAALFLASFTACGSKQETAKQEAMKQETAQAGQLAIKQWGPTDIKAGQIFNKQPNGESAIWARTENATPATVFVLNGVALESYPQENGTLVTAIIPRSLYEKAGEYPIYLLDKDNNNKSNEVKFIVKP